MKRIGAALLLVAMSACHCGGTGLTRVSRTAVLDASVDLGRPFLGDEATAELAIRSTGRGTVNVKRVVSTNPAVTLHWSGEPAGMVTSAGTLQIELRWQPTVVETLTGTIEVDLETDDPALNHQVAQVIGQSREIPDCDDHNQCTDDSFDKRTEQCHHVDSTSACDDGNACTVDDRCQDAVCRGVARTCDDHDVCTLNLCDPVSGCVYPPDGRICADDDPCTKDVCDPSGGCQHPNAPDGTACGTFSCSTAHLCVFGGCRELDISASSEGYPCTDGNVCTEGDTCHSGQCQSGPLGESGPEVRQTLPTFGGAHAYVATDGFRYLFVDSDASENPRGLRLTTWDGSALIAGGSLDLKASAAPIAFAPGKFLVPHGSRVSLIDAADAMHPVLVWDAELASTGAFARIQHLERMTGGIIVLGEALTGHTSVVEYFPLADVTNPPVAGRVIAQSIYVADLDAAENVLAFATDDGVIWQRVDASGAPLLSAQIPFASASRVTVQGAYVAALAGDALAVFQVTPDREPLPCQSGYCASLEPGCDGSFAYAVGNYQLCTPNASVCPMGAHCETVNAVNAAADVECSRACCDQPYDVCFTPATAAWRSLSEAVVSPVNDILLQGGALYRATPEGIVMNGPTDPPGVANPAQLVDPFPAEAMERATRHLLAQGPMALALRPKDTGFERVTGTGLGEVSAIADEVIRDLDRELVGGPMSVGEILPPVLLPEDSADPGFHFGRWYTPETPPDSSHVRVLDGAARTSLIETIPGATVAGPTYCSGAVVEMYRAPLGPEERSVCGLESGWVTATPYRLWSAPQTLPLSSAAVSWSFLTAMTNPDISIPNRTENLNYSLRGSESGGDVGLLQGDSRPSVNRPRLWRLREDSPSAYAGEYALEGDPSTYPSASSQFAVEGALAITVVRGVARLHSALPVNDTPPIPAVALPSVVISDPLVEIRIVGMSGGHAWLSLRHIVDGKAVPEVLELAYSADGSSLRVLGGADLPGLATSVLEDRGTVFVTTPAGVIVLAPGCER